MFVVSGTGKRAPPLSPSSRCHGFQHLHANMMGACARVRAVTAADRAARARKHKLDRERERDRTTGFS